MLRKCKKIHKKHEKVCNCLHIRNIYLNFATR